MLGTSWECHQVREFALRPMGDFLLVLDLKVCLEIKHLIGLSWRCGRLINTDWLMF